MDSLIVLATLDSLELVNSFITRATAQVGLDDHAAWQVQLAVDEAVTNVIQHGYAERSPGTIDLSWQVVEDQLEIRLRDHGQYFDPQSIPAPDVTSPLEERQPGGLGFFLMQKLMDDLHFEHNPREGNLLVMLKHIPRPVEGVSLFSLSGRLDAVASQQALERPRAAIAGGIRRVLLDLSEVSFMSSSGLRALLLLRKDLLAHGGELRLCGLREHVQEVFALTGFTQVFAIHLSREDALAAFGQR
ncbi:MAG: anti-sigma factor antagonist [Roseiflexaceae bacterium]|nr:anti-sigma factor antagonist [Roseiflexaceae bacterium]